MAYSTLQLGSQGDEVKKLQEALKNAGYDLGVKGVDGIYGAKTSDAVEAYQSANGLIVDGIAGNNTLTHLYSAPPITQQQVETPAAPEPVVTYDPAQDQNYLAAQEKLQTLLNQAPTYAGTFDQQLQEIYDKIMSRPDFKYDQNNDPWWQSYKDQYIQGGQMAMVDTMGQAAALTGGYGSSYGQQVGQQTYNQYLHSLNEKVPELYQLALNRYQMEGDKLAEQYAMTGNMAAEEYGKYQDTYNQWLNQLGLAREDEQVAYDRGQNQWQTQYGVQQDNYNKLSSLISSTGYTPTAQELANAGMSESEAAALGQYYIQASTPSYSSSGGGSYSSSGSEEAAGILSAMLSMGDDTAAWDYLMASGLSSSLVNSTWEMYQSQKNTLEPKKTGGVLETLKEGAASLWDGFKNSLSGGSEKVDAGTLGIMSKEDYARRTGSGTSYDAYVRDIVEGAVADGRITEAQGIEILIGKGITY